MKAKSIPIMALLAMTLFLATSVTTAPVLAAKSSIIVLDSSTCFTVFAGIWDSPTSTCTIAGSAGLQFGRVLNIPQGTTLAVSNSLVFDQGFLNNGDVNNYGTITTSSGGNGVGFLNFDGTITNFGTITISNGVGFLNFGGCCSFPATLINYGTITISDVGSLENAGTVTNYGTINISNSGSDGFLNTGFGLVTNRGTIMINNTGLDGFISFGLVRNYGTMRISNSGPFTVGFENGGGRVTNHGTIRNCGGPSGFVNLSGSTFTGNPVITCH